MKKVKVIEIKNGEKVYNLAATEAGGDWIRAGRLLKEGKLSEFEKMDNTPMYYRDEQMITDLTKSNMERKIDTTIDEITLSVIRFNTDIENNNPSGVTKFVTVFVPLLERFKSLMSYPENKILEHLLNFKTEVSNLFDYLFIEGNINEVAKKLIEQNENEGIKGTILAIKRNGNLLNSIPDNRSISFKKQTGRNLINDFVLKYQGLYKIKKNEPDTIIDYAYIKLIYNRFKEWIKEPLELWAERFVYPSETPVKALKIDSKVNGANDRLIILAILSEVYKCPHSDFVYEDFVLKRFGIKNFHKAISTHKEKQEYKTNAMICRQIL